MVRKGFCLPHKTLKNLDDNIKKQSINIQKNDININNILEQIQDVSYEEIKKDKKLVISKSKTLMESGYKKFL